MYTVAITRTCGSPKEYRKRYLFPAVKVSEQRVGLFSVYLLRYYMLLTVLATQNLQTVCFFAIDCRYPELNRLAMHRTNIYSIEWIVNTEVHIPCTRLMLLIA